MSDLTAAVEAAKRVATQQKHTQQEEAAVAKSLLDLTSQPLYRRRKDFANWYKDGCLWKWESPIGMYYVAYFDNDVWKWQPANWGSWHDTHFASQELAQAACEDYFWSELERDVLEMVNP